MSGSEMQRDSVFQQNSGWLRACLFVLFISATLLRLYGIHAPGHLLDREYTSAILARAYYYSNNDQVADWQREIAIAEKNQQPVLEPPLLEFVVSLIYRVMGRENFYDSRYLTIMFWLVGGIFMFLIGRKLLSSEEALVATAYYLLAPMGIIISRSFQPDSLMMMLYLVSLYAIVLYFESPSAKRLLLAGALSSVALLLRPLVIFGIFCSFLAFSIHRNRNWKKIIDVPLLTFSAVSLLPAAVYYGYGIMVAGFMSWKIPTSFMPYLLVKRDFWFGWADLVINVAKLGPLLLAMAGFFLLRNSKVRFWMVGLGVAFVLFSVAFTYHIHTHPYYHIQLFPLVGLCMAPPVVLILKSLKSATERYWWVLLTAAFLFSIFSLYREMRSNLYNTQMERPAVAREIGEIVNHSPHTVYVSFYYGLPLIYYGQFGGAPWPVRIENEFYRRPGEKELSVQERIQGLGFVPEYFVVTHFDLYQRKHQDLNEYLTQHCSVLAESEQYLIYSSCSE